MIDLKNITLLNLNCLDPDIGVKALKYSQRGINFGRTVLVSHENPDNLTDDIEFVYTRKLTSVTVNHFYFQELNKIIKTDYVLSIQTDGFVINPENWRNEFLDYDYIGAPWPSKPWNQKNRVGNGGFVLISKKFLSYLGQLELPEGRHNDGAVTNIYYDFFINKGCKYAPIEVAAKFSLEHIIPEVVYDLNDCFGFHGTLTHQSRRYVEMIKDYEG